MNYSRQKFIKIYFLTKGFFLNIHIFLIEDMDGTEAYYTLKSSIVSFFLLWPHLSKEKKNHTPQ
jgi:hypothetical protein